MKYFLLLAVGLAWACQPSNPTQTDDPADWRSLSAADWQREVIQTEDSFANYAETYGIGEAFLAFADSSAVLMRDQQLIRDLPLYFGELHGPDERKLSWTPEFVEVSEAGDMAYTYGTYQYYPHRDSAKVYEGIFHTVWKRQADGSWKYVWD